MRQNLLRISLSICLFVCTLFGVGAQTFRAYAIAGEKALKDKDYFAAMLYYGKALEQQPDHLPTLLLYADAAQASFSLELAAKTYEKLIQRDKAKQYPQAWFKLGQVYKILGQYDKAKIHFENYLQMQPNGSWLSLAKTEIESCSWAMESLNQPLPFKVNTLGNKVNSDFSDFAPLLAGDTLYYSSYRFDLAKDKHKPRRKQTKLMFSVKGARGKALSNQLNVEGKHTAHIAFSIDKQRMYFTLCDFVGATNIRCAIYYREKDKRKRWKPEMTKLPDSINVAGYTFTQPCIAYDSILKTEVLFFVSDRPGGQGGLDIWQAAVLKGDNKFGTPVNLAAINSTGNDVTPFFHQNSQTLYFSTDGRSGFGGYDVMEAKYAADQGWQPGKPLGAPFNSSYNDLYYVLLPDGKKGYLASNRTGTQYLDPKLKSCCNDIFEFAYVPPPPPKQPDTLGTPSLPGVSNEFPVVAPPPPGPPSRLEDFLPFALYFDNDEPDKRTRKTVTRRDYTQTFYPYYERREEYIAEYTRGLNNSELEQAEAAMESFFEDEVRKGQEWLLHFAQILSERLILGDSVEIFIKGFTSPRAESDYNLALGKRRISSLRNFFNTYENGVFQPFLNTSQLKITERSFGETTARKEVSDDLFDVKNSVFSIGAAKERRVEIVEIKTSGND